MNPTEMISRPNELYAKLKRALILIFLEYIALWRVWIPSLKPSVRHDSAASAATPMMKTIICPTLKSVVKTSQFFAASW
ncbi:MAG: hypothetical protein LBT05_00275 [Planctomycetaceae bacterium]|nr:hypothetical protein [Planctomycetaceae bacterium]